MLVVTCPTCHGQRSVRQTAGDKMYLGASRQCGSCAREATWQQRRLTQLFPLITRTVDLVGRLRTIADYGRQADSPLSELDAAIRGLELETADLAEAAMVAKTGVVVA